MKQQLNEVKRMQRLAGIIKENTQFDEDKLKKYHEYLLDLGGGDLGGDYKDILSKAKQFDSVEEFIEDDINILATDDKAQADKIRKWVKQNIKMQELADISEKTSLNPIKSIDEVEAILKEKIQELVQDYIDETIETAGEDLDFGNGVIGYDNKKQLIQDFFDYAKGYFDLK